MKQKYLTSSICMVANSSLMPIVKGLNISTENINVIDKVKAGTNKYAIIICSVGQLTPALHYMLIKYKNGTFKLLDSLYNMDHVTFNLLISRYGMDQVVWESFTLEANGKLALERDFAYYYTGAGILIK